jgi:hypothetical protein
MRFPIREETVVAAQRPQFGEEAFNLLWTGIRRAHRHKVVTVGSDYPLMQICEELTDAAKAFAPKIRTKGKIAGYLSAVGGVGVDEPRWKSSEQADPDVPLEVRPLLREAQWKATPDQAAGSTPWTAGLVDTASSTLQAAMNLGVSHAHSVQLALGVFADPTNRASEALAACEIDREETLEALRALPSARTDGAPWTPAIDQLDEDHALEAEEKPGFVGRLFSRHHDASTLPALRAEAVRQAVRLGASQVDERHLLLAIVSLDEQLAAAERGLADGLEGENDAAANLRTSGVAVEQLVGLWLDPAVPILPELWPSADTSTWTAPAVAAVFEKAGTTAVFADLAQLPSVREALNPASRQG